jgi:flagellar protein FliO/FliZ
MRRLLPLTAVCLPLPAAADGSVVASSLLQMLLALTVVLSAIGITAFLLRRLNRFSTPATGAFRILGGLSLGARERVVLLQVGDQQLLLGVAPGRVQTLHVLDKPLALSAPAAASEFAERLARLMRRGQS